MEPRIYVASLTDYNSGILHGVWIDVDEFTDVEGIQEQVDAMLKASPAASRYNETAEEWAIHDSESLGSISKSESFASIVDLAQAINEHGDAALVYIENHGDFDKEHFEDSYVGKWGSFTEYAEELADELIACENGDSELLTRYFDYESFARDLEMDHWHELAQGGGVHIFRDC